MANLTKHIVTPANVDGESFYNVCQLARITHHANPITSIKAYDLAVVVEKDSDGNIVRRFPGYPVRSLLTAEDIDILTKSFDRLKVWCDDVVEGSRVIAKARLANSADGFAEPGWANRCIVELETDGQEFRVDSEGNAEVVWP